MKDRYLLIGTAGHVDHGKTELIRALTGIDTDRLKEEKERGISIELGFAYLTLPNGRKAGIVDVPGHEKFVRQMLAGASGMDIVLLVIAADEGVMPQTREHLDILTLLGISRGIIVLTKTDLVEEEWLQMVEEDIRQAFADSIFAEAPICRVSSLTGQGIPRLLQTIVDLLDKTEGKRLDLPARMPIDRVFSIQGFGTVVTGTVHSGIFQKGQDVLIEPGHLPVKIRNIEVHHRQVASASAGQRAAFNLSGISVDEIKKGTNLVVPGYFKTGQIIDVKLSNLQTAGKPLKQRQRIRFHHGTAEILGRIHLVAQEELLPGEETLAQILLEEPVVAAGGDRFVLRFYSPAATIGGGTVLGIAPSKRKRFREKELEQLRILAEGKPEETIKKELAYPRTLEELLKSTEKNKEDIIRGLEKLKNENLLLVISEDGRELFWLKDKAESWLEKAKKITAVYLKGHPLQEGISREELKNKLNMKCGSAKLWQAILEWWAKEGHLRLAGGRVQTADRLKLPVEIERKLNCLRSAWEKARLNPPDLEQGAAECGIGVDEVQEYASYLCRQGEWQRIGDYYFAKTAVDKAKEQLIAFLENNGQVTVAEARDFWQTSRKYAVPLLEYFDSIRLTKRDGAIRYKVR